MKIGYARVSTVDQNLERQIDALEQAGCQLIYKEKMSGKNADRYELNAMIAAAQEGDVIIVQKLDRLGRSLVDLFEIVGKLRDKGAGFISLTETIDTTSSHGRLVFSILGAVAEFERAIILDRVNDGLSNAKKNGRVGGRPYSIDIVSFENDHLSGMTNAELSKKYKITKMSVWRAVKKIKDRRLCLTPAEPKTLPPEE